MDLTVPAEAPALELFLENALPGADLEVIAADSGVILMARGAEAPTERRWTVITPAGGAVVRLRFSPPDAEVTQPWRFAVFADVQEDIDRVQDIYRRMNQDPGIRFAVMSGDLTSRGGRDELLRFQRELKTLAFPVYATLGNHELGTRDDLFHEYYGRGNFSFPFRGVRFTLLDSASATIAPAAYDWLDGWLTDGRDGLHFVFMHIPPLDPVGTRGGAFASRLEANKLLSRLAAGAVDTTFYGHVHSYYAYSNAGIPAYITGGGGGIPERFDGIARHYLVVDVDPGVGLAQTALVRVD
jgi:3',5'-cyclic AMP phosphodiesterase CpdA